ncbi:late secretory pathway protein AVL9 homolog isoform X4 [Portunus trituberculatus]|uniref:late secretory pathway protein AVL9 homolog isoform X4 n=1 Tax=Portunus trituberculatus TaxID=210409 RepID=UPI001E1CBF66|nr:late secretory pathway protein AVL9 homolog isoform X4 [Portunus trituberculatus]
MEEKDRDPAALHVIVVGFHHKKGMQVEYAYPPLSESDDCELPDLWRHLPSLCLPDGAHNHEADTVFFHLPHLTKPDQTVYGVSCYRQIDAEKITNKSADITRNTVQKSVCVLSTLPIYGYIQERLQVTTKVYFKGADFSDVQDLKGLYQDLNSTNWRDKLAHGVFVSDAVRVFGRNILVLFKLILLEKRVLFYHSPVGPLVRTITSLMALFPDNFPNGLAHAASMRSRGLLGLAPLLPNPTEADYKDVCYAEDALTTGVGSNEADCNVEEIETDNIEKCGVAAEDTTETMQVTDIAKEADPSESNLILRSNKIEEESEPSKIINVTNEDSMHHVELSTDSALSASDDLSERRSSNSSLTSVTSRGSIMSPPEFNGAAAPTTAANITTKMVNLKGKLSGAFSYWTGKEKSPPQEKPSATATPNPSPSEPGDDVPLSPTTGGSLSQDSALTETDSSVNFCQSPPEKFAALVPSDCGLPLEIFTKGNLLHPYLSLQYLDVLSAPTTRAFLVGASNTLFIHKRPLYDVLVQLEEGKIEIPDPDLKRQLSLSMEDLRFAENIVRQVEAVSATLNTNKAPNGTHPTINHPDVFLEGVGWVGGEEWLRYQFKVYLLSLLRSSVCPEGSREYEVFNGNFMTAWKGTHNFRVWVASGPYTSLMELTPGHPHAGHLSMTDMRIRLSHTIQGLDKSRRINQTLATTGTAVVKTKEAVGGALTSARGAISHLWSSFTTTNNSTTTVDCPLAESAMEVTEIQCIDAQDQSDAMPATEEAAKSVNEDKPEEGTDITLGESALPSDVAATQ